MKKTHLSSIFYLIINIVIFTSCAAGDDFNDQFEKLLENWKLGDEMETSESDAKLSDQADSMPSHYNKFRRDSTSGEFIGKGLDDNIIDNIDVVGKDMTFDDAAIHYMLDHIRVRDVNGQTAMTKPTDTFNGKLIPCFIH